jgi:CAAX prenyl protease-like protein
MAFLPAGSLPYVVPYGLFLGLVELQGRVPALAAPLFALRVLVPAALCVHYWRAGAYPELSGYRVEGRTLFDIAFGVAIATLWVGVYLALPTLPRGEAFDPAVLGTHAEALALGLRLAGFALVTPVVEELFVRSFLPRLADMMERSDFRSAPIARFTLRSFVVTVVWFTLTHAAWEWWVALPTGIALNAWLVWRGHLGACVVAHAAANAAIWALVVLGPLPLWQFL